MPNIVRVVIARAVDATLLRHVFSSFFLFLAFRLRDTTRDNAPDNIVGILKSPIDNDASY